jgi:hypothetical protein
MAEHSPMMCGDIAGRGACLQSRDTIPRDPPNTPRGDPFSSRHGEEWSMRNMMLTVGALLLATAVGGCATYPTYGYGYGPAYGYVPNAYGVYPYNNAYRYPPNYAYRYPPVYTSDYNGYFGTYQSNGGGNG